MSKLGSKVRDALEKMAETISGAADEANKQYPVKWGDYFDKGLNKGVDDNVNKTEDEAEKTTIADTNAIVKEVMNGNEYQSIENDAKMITDEFKIDTDKLESNNLKEFGFDENFNVQSIKDGTFDGGKFLSEQGVKTDKLNNINQYIPKDFNAKKMAEKIKLPTSTDPSISLPDIKEFMSGGLKDIKVKGLKDEGGKNDVKFDMSKYSNKIKGFSKYFDIDKILKLSGIDKEVIRSQIEGFGDSIKEMGTIKGDNFSGMGLGLEDVQSFNLEDFTVPETETPNLSFSDLPNMELPEDYESGEFSEMNFSSLIDSGNIDYKPEFSTEGLGTNISIPNIQNEMSNPIKIDNKSLGFDISLELDRLINDIKIKK